MANEDLYRILELSNDATLEEVKRAYRRLARQFHPDRNSDPAQNQQFRQIQQAYEVLSDPDRRMLYDRAARAQGEPRHRSTADNAAHRKGSRNRSSSRTEKNDSNQGIGSTLRKMFTGIHEVPGNRGRTSSTGDQSSRDSKNAKKAETAQRTRVMAETTDGTNLLLRLAERVLGSLTVEIAIDALESISGAKRTITIETESRARKVNLDIPPGIVSGSVLEMTLAAEGDFSKQSIKIRVHVHPHPLVDREGSDVTVKLPITVREALQGGELDVPTADGPVRVKLPAGWDLEKRLRVKDCGFKDPATGQVGELYLKVYVVLPKSNDSNVVAAATAIEHFYSAPVRANIPNKIGRRS